MTSLWILRIKCTTSFNEGSLPNSIFEREWQFVRPIKKKEKNQTRIIPLSHNQPWKPIRWQRLLLIRIQWHLLRWQNTSHTLWSGSRTTKRRFHFYGEFRDRSQKKRMTPFFFEGESVWLEALNALSMFALWLLPSHKDAEADRFPIRHGGLPRGHIKGFRIALFSFLFSRNHNPLNFATNYCRRIATTKSH